MGQDPWSNLSVQISRRRWRCVPDPMLCLSHEGADFVRGLASHAEVWLGPEFLNILDSWILYDRKPDLLMQSMSGCEAPEEIRDALRVWRRLRDESGHVGGRLCWVRDALRESCLPPGMEESFVPRWEAMAEALDQRLSTAAEANGPVVAAIRDHVALCSVLPGAVLICQRDPVKSELPPALCRHLEAWRLPCRRLDVGDDLVALERGLLLRMLVEAGLAGFVWGGLGLAVAHLVVPGHCRLPSGLGFAGGEELDFLAEGEPRPIKGAWEDARAYWYNLAAEDPYAGP